MAMPIACCAGSYSGTSCCSGKTASFFFKRAKDTGANSAAAGGAVAVRPMPKKKNSCGVKCSSSSSSGGGGDGGGVLMVRGSPKRASGLPSDSFIDCNQRRRFVFGQRQECPRLCLLQLFVIGALWCFTLTTPACGKKSEVQTSVEEYQQGAIAYWLWYNRVTKMLNDKIVAAEGKLRNTRRLQKILDYHLLKKCKRANEVIQKALGDIGGVAKDNEEALMDFGYKGELSVAQDTYWAWKEICENLYNEGITYAKEIKPLDIEVAIQSLPDEVTPQHNVKGMKTWSIDHTLL